MSVPSQIPEDEVTRPWWDETRRRRLAVQRCATCGLVQLPPRLLCTGCGGDELTLAPAGRRGVVDSYTVVHRAPVPDVAVPYTVARVRLVDGPILLTRLVGEFEPHCDQPVVLTWLPLPDGRALPVFTREL
ncbi:Zn-ribbon domain-containing OB-fold protein [Catellatospora tritici]|uniref:Zn-ribbon domain-containing OB-fold protein n=1 Tax=Catellatospora tritici TaxID=2851566 RepID=UPI001C2D6427|nr:OB-fold domain-containing protein [Catellatospora tritici]MBV1852614.1 OB-fold domain-containing protein [Catellatospora tritici]